MKRKWFSKKILASLFGTTVLAGVPLLVSSCGVDPDNKLVQNSYLTSQNGDITSNVDLKTISTQSLKTNDGMKAFLKAVTNQIIYDWLLNAIKNDRKLNRDYQTKLNEINKAYDDEVEKYQKDNGNNWQLKFQQEVLDVNGGTEQAYKQTKINEYARTAFADKLFENFFSTVYDDASKKVIFDPTADQILDGLYGISKTEKKNMQGQKQIPTMTYKFDSNAILTSDDTNDKQYASFQSYLFDEYVQYVNPYIVNMSLWKYGTPKEGITQYYQVDFSNSGSGGSEEGATKTKNAISTREGENGGGENGSGSTTPSSTSGSYIYPYFGNENQTNVANGTITKFKGFLSGTTSNYITNNDLGLKNIPLRYTDDSATAILAKNSTIFNDLYTEFAMGSAYLYGKLGSPSSSGKQASFALDDINNSITHNIDISSPDSNGLDDITRNFVGKSSLYSTSSTPSIPSGTSKAAQTTNKVSELKLSNSLVKQIVNEKGPLSKLADKTAMSSSGSSATNNGDVYVIDNFVPGTIKVNGTSQLPSTGNGNPLSEYMFLRNQAGVHAISIDGSTLINKATSEKQRKEYAGYIVLYRYLMGEKVEGQTFKIDLPTELKNFLTSNVDWLVYNYAASTNVMDKMFNLDSIGNSEQTLAKAISDFLSQLSFYNGAEGATSKIYQAKNPYSLNYGYNTFKNGFASNFNYALFNSTASGSTKTLSNNGLKINNDFLYQPALLASTSQNPYTKTNGKSTYETAIDATNTYIASLTNLGKQVADFEGHKYSQYVYTNNKYLNSSLSTFMGNASVLGAYLKTDAYKNYIGYFYDESKNTFKLANGSTNSTLTTALQSGLFNFFFLPGFSQAEDKWVFYDQKNNQPNGNDLISSIRTYSKSVWDDEGNKDYGVKLTNSIALYNTIASIKYLIGENNDYANFMAYLKTTIGNNKAFVVWENSVNKNLKDLQNKNTTSPTPAPATDATQSITSKSLIEMSNVTNNVNNSYGSAYLGKTSSNTTAVDFNIDNSGFYQTNKNNSFYIATNAPTSATAQQTGKSYQIGFKGLQTASNSTISAEVSEAIFSKPYNYNIGLTGSLYHYQSKENIKTIINSFNTIESLRTFANTLDALLNYKYLLSEDINNEATTLAQKKEILSNKVDSFDKSYFEQFSGYVGKKVETSNGGKANENATTDSVEAFSPSLGGVNLYGAYAIELSYNDFDSFTTLKSKLGTNADEIAMQLLVQAALNPTVQAKVIQDIAISNRVTSYDVRVKQAFGNDAIFWLNNWK